MLRALFCTGILLAFTVMQAAAAAPTASVATVPLPRLAVVCLDDNDRTTALADLVQLELGKSGKVEMVERAEFERILAEQKLSAAGLTAGGAQVAVGKALRADALLLLERDRKAKVFRVRLTDTLYAAQLCRMTVTNQDAATAEEASALVSKAALAALPKLAVPPAQRLLVTVVDFRNGTMSQDYAWVEKEVPDLLEAALVREPRIFVLDRERLRELLKEVQSTAGIDAAFTTGAILVDGDLMVKQGVALGNGAVPVILALRLRDGALNEIGRAQAEGTLDKARELVPPVQTELVKRILALGPQKPVSVETEKKLLLEVASRAVGSLNLTEYDPGKAITYTEAAHGLDAKDPQAVRALLAALPAGTAVNALGATSSPAAIQKAVDAVLRIQELLPLATPADREEACFRLTGQQFGVLITANAKDLTAEQRAQLRPMREILRKEAEQRWRDKPSWLLHASQVFFEDASAHNDYVKALIERFLDPAQTPPATRACNIARVFNTFTDDGLGPFLCLTQPAQVRDNVLAFLEQLTRHEDCVVRFFAARELADLAAGSLWAGGAAVDPARQRKYATVALAALPDVLARDELYANIRVVERNDVGPLRAGCPSVREWAAARGADPGDALARIARFQADLLDKGDLARYILTSWILSDLPPQEAIRLIDQAAALLEKMEHAHPPVVHTVEERRPYPIPAWKKEFYDYITFSLALRTALANRYFPEIATADGPGRKNLLCTQSPAWKALFAEVSGKWGQMLFMPWTLHPASRLLVDGDTVWIVFNTSGTLLAQVDLNTRRVLRTWIGPTPADESSPRGFPTVMCRWGDTLCVGTQLGGVSLCPATNEARQQETQINASTGGLLDQRVTALAAFGDDLYIGTQSGVWKYNRRAATTELVASSKAQGTTRSLQPASEVARLVTDSKVSRLYIFTKPPVRVLDKQVHVYRWVPATGELTDLSPILMPKRPPPAADGALNTSAYQPLDVTVDPFKFHERLSIFDPNTEKIVFERGVIPVLPQDCSWQEESVALWHQDALVVRVQAGFFREYTWSVEQLSGLPMPVAAPK